MQRRKSQGIVQNRPSFMLRPPKKSLKAFRCKPSSRPVHFHFHYPLQSSHTFICSKLDPADLTRHFCTTQSPDSAMTILLPDPPVPIPDCALCQQTPAYTTRRQDNKSWQLIGSRVNDAGAQGDRACRDSFRQGL